MKDKKIELGDLVKDPITGFEGVVICCSSWLNNCDTVGLRPQKLHDGKPLDAIFFDVPQLIIIEKNWYKNVTKKRADAQKPAGRLIT